MAVAAVGLRPYAVRRSASPPSQNSIASARRQPVQQGDGAGLRRVRLRRYTQKVQAIAEPPPSRNELEASGPFQLAPRGPAEDERTENCDGRTCEGEWTGASPESTVHELGPPELSGLEDNLWTFLVISPLVVSFWRGGWELMDTVFYPGDNFASAWASLAFGAGVVTALKVLEPSLERKENELADALQERFFTFALALGGIGIWHGLWHLYDEYLAFLGPQNGPLLSFAVGTVGLLCVRNLRSVLPVPSAPLALDDDKTYGLRIGTLKSALKSRGWKWLWP